ncbi:MAG: hypothetical protein KDA78_20805, partial [Planctomycetaceae bacterium]|nr:hypothetical protein [Planctomycetaceae bacterium]
MHFPFIHKGYGMSKQLSALLILLLCPAFLQAELQLPQFFSDHMVLQQKRDVAVWGTADPGARVTVSFNKYSSTTKADRSGKWRVSIPSGKANSEGMPLTIQSGDEIHSIKDVLVGEVWFASGQSNMVFSMNRVPAYEQVIAESDYP